jgi:hypothetical protein
MEDDPLHSVYAYVERAYVRLQAGDLLTRCVDENSLTPVLQMVEGLVLAGPQSLQALREVLAETTQRKAQVQDDLNQLHQNLDKTLRSFGIYFQYENLPEMVTLPPEHFRQMLIAQQANEEAQVTCTQIFLDSQELVEGLSSRLGVLGEIEEYLKDWLWGLVYQSVCQVATSNL